ncbi:uncharacterized protein [Oryza sativa Japonica Group]|uniref:uncharacterized protein isoform X2 n=1 Tax=Oryza sativa subsp. japonica TaxID=39947 RepID=UPI0007755300|nr:uncharacterized protein LOC4343150 isoform X1 [Oryza sativa Japonica Group]KAF2922670.1 hypothetical protein DAI22_07g130600 [Oryza sativa Japonica Group]
MHADLVGSSGDSEPMLPKIHGKRSDRPRGRNHTPWAPLQGLLNSVRNIRKYVNDRSVGSKMMKSTERDSMSSSASETAPKLKDNNGEDTKYKLLEIKTEITERIDPKTRGKRSARHRVKEPALWTSQDELQKFETGKNRNGNEQAVYSRKRKKTASKGEAKTGTGNDVTEKTGVRVIDTSAEVKNSTSENTNQKDGVPTLNTPMDKKLSGADAFKQEDALIADDAGAGLKDSNGAAASALDQHATGATNPMENKADNGVSGAEAALASIYGEPSEWDMCITFAVKLLMDEMPLPEDAAEVEEFFRQSITNIAGSSVP